MRAAIKHRKPTQYKVSALCILACSLLIQLPVVAELDATAGSLKEQAEQMPANLPNFSLPAAGSLPLPENQGIEQEANRLKSKSPTASEKLGTQEGSLESKKKEQTLETKSALSRTSTEKVQTASPRSALAISATAVPVPLASIYRGGLTMAQESKLANGLKVLILESHEFPVVSTLVWYGVGSRDEQTGQKGLCHMVEHLMFQDVGPFKAGEIGSMIARVGGQFNGYTSDDFTTFFETLPANKLEMALKIESERMSNTRFSDNEVRQEIGNIQKEFDNESKDPLALLSNEVRAMMFMQHPYHSPTLGWKTDVETLTSSNAKAFYDKFFHPNNATLVIAGDVNAKQTMALVSKYFEHVKPAPQGISHVSVNEPLPRSERRVNTKYAGNKELLQLAYRSPAMEDPDAPAMVVLERILNGGLNGRLKSKLVDSRLCSLTQANYEIKKEPGLFTITCTAVPGTYNAQARILESLDSLIMQIRDKGITESELKKARNQAEFAYFAECDGPYRAGFHLGYFESLDKWQNSYTWADRIRAVSSADVNRVAKKYLSPEARVVGWIAGTQAPKALPPKSTTEAPKDQGPTNHKIMGQSRLTGYKDNDSAPSPQNNRNKEKKSGIPAVIRDIPQALGNAVTGNIPGAVGNVGSAVINLPGAIGDIGLAVGNTASALGKQIAQLKAGAESEFPHISSHVTKNGVNIIVFESHISPIMQISGSLQAGEAYSGKGKAYSLLAASLLGQGSQKRNRSQVLSFQDELGIAPSQMLKFDSGIETIDFSSRCLSRDLPAQLELIAETLALPALDQASLERARQEALQQLKRNEESAADRVDRVLLQNLLDENSPFCPADPSDRAKSISSAGLAEMEKFFGSHLVPGATTIVLCGDGNPQQIFALADRVFEKWNGKNTHTQLHAKLRNQRVLRVSLPSKDSKRSTVSFGQIVPMTATHPDYGSLLIADGVLINHPMVSRFEQALSKSKPLETAIAGGDMKVKLESLSNLSRWSLALALDPGAVPISVKSIKNELRLLSRNGINPEEFLEVKRYLLGSLPVRKRATLGAVSSSLLDSVEHSNSVSDYGAEIASIKAASLDSVNKVIRGAFKPEHSTIVIAGGAESIKAVRASSANSAKSDSAKNASKPEVR